MAKKPSHHQQGDDTDFPSYAQPQAQAGHQGLQQTQAGAEPSPLLKHLAKALAQGGAHN